VEKSGNWSSLGPFIPFGRCSAGGPPRQKLQNKTGGNWKGKQKTIVA